MQRVLHSVILLYLQLQILSELEGLQVTLFL